MNNRTKLKALFGMIIICLFLSASLGSPASGNAVSTEQKREGHRIQVLDKGKWAPDTYKSVQNLLISMVLEVQHTIQIENLMLFLIGIIRAS